MAFFSVIIPLYNKELFIESTVRSVLNQSFTDFELIIVNDGSTDASESKISLFNDNRIRYFSKINEGVSAARNYGIEKATADYVAFLDADDFWYPTFLETIKRNMLEFPDHQIFASAKEVETAQTVFPAQYTIKNYKETTVVNYFESSLKESILWTSAAVFHKSVFEKAGVFDPKVMAGEDTDLWIRIGLVYAVVFNPQVLTRYTYDKESVSRDARYIFEERTFSKYTALEKDNLSLKAFLDFNRFSVALKYKLLGDKTQFQKYSQEISPSNLNLKKHILIRMPKWLLEILIKFKVILVNIGIGRSVFR